MMFDVIALFTALFLPLFHSDLFSFHLPVLANCLSKEDEYNRHLISELFN